MQIKIKPFQKQIVKNIKELIEDEGRKTIAGKNGATRTVHHTRGLL
jgi:hypothetical protein